MKIPQLTVTQRTSIGSNKCRTMRQKTDQVPGVIYGKGAEPTMIQCAELELAEVIAHGAHMVKVDAGKGERPALVKEIQWDTYGDKILHFDLRRVELTDRITVPVAIDFKYEDECPGTKEGGVVNKLKKVVHLTCPAGEIPESVLCDLRKLVVDGHLTFGDLELPASAELDDDARDNVVICPIPKEEDAKPAEEGAPTAPEVIGKKKPEEGEK
ncbi:MAG: 50S ribosomal protein L25 [Planctomycetota bacterium]